MKGKIKVKVEVTDECGSFPIIETWEYTRDNTLETLDEWVELFNKILTVQGFYSQVDIKDEKDED